MSVVCAYHSGAAVDVFLKDKNYRGFLNADAHNVYDHLFASGDMIEVGCWTHCRRKFFDAKESDPARAHLVLAHVRQLYEVEDKAKKLSAERNLSPTEADELRRQLRQEEALPVLTELRSWLLDEEAKVLPKSLTGLAIAYANTPQPGWYAVSVNSLQGHQFYIPDGSGNTHYLTTPSFTYFQRFPPIAFAGDSIYIYYIDLKEANRVRSVLNLPVLKP